MMACVDVPQLQRVIYLQARGRVCSHRCNDKGAEVASALCGATPLLSRVGLSKSWQHNMSPLRALQAQLDRL